MRPVKLKASARLLADSNNHWQKEVEDDYKGKYEPYGDKLPEGTFTDKSPGNIANKLKQHSEDHGEASSKLNMYVNRQGRNLQGADKVKMDQTKEALDQAYGMENKPTKPADTTKTTSSSEGLIYVPPEGHNEDDPFLKTGLDEDPDTEPMLNASARLLK